MGFSIAAFIAASSATHPLEATGISSHLEMRFEKCEEQDVRRDRRVEDRCIVVHHAEYAIWSNRLDAHDPMSRIS